MKKIVYNTCFGGFGLSPLAQQEYAKLKGITLYFYKQTEYSYSGGIDTYIKVLDIENYNNFTTQAFTKNYGDKFSSYEKGTFYYPDISRDDTDLVTVVEKLGKLANGSCTNLAIATVEGKWRIDEYDGSESVETPSSYDWND